MRTPGRQSRSATLSVPAAPRWRVAYRTDRMRDRRRMRAGPSLDQLVRPEQHRPRDRQAERLGGLQVDHQLELRGLLDREIAGLGALEDLVHIDGGASDGVIV